jgi:hypothetical protein
MLPFVIESPTENALLPETPQYSLPNKGDRTDSGRPVLVPQQKHAITVTIGSVPLSSFQLSARISSLLHRALKIEKARDPRPDRMPPTATFKALDREIRQATYTLLEQTTRWETVLDCFAMCVR